MTRSGGSGSSFQDREQAGEDDERDEEREEHNARDQHVSAAARLRALSNADRHSDPRLTRNVYTDARLLPLAEAVSSVRSMIGDSYPPETQNLGKTIDEPPKLADTPDVTPDPTNMQPKTPGPQKGSRLVSRPQGSEALASFAATVRSLPPKGVREDGICRRQESKVSPESAAELLTAAADLLVACAHLVAGSSKGVGNVQRSPESPHRVPA